MNQMESHEIIVQRTLKALTANGEIFDINLSFEKPQMDTEEGGDWYCSFYITNENISENKTAYGIDSLHALLLSLKMADSLLKHLSLQNQFNITWLDEPYESFLQNI